MLKKPQFFSTRFYKLKHTMHDSLERERVKILLELSQMRGFVPLLIRHRHGEKWTIEERMTMTKDLRAISHLSPYLLPAVLPGGFLLLPILAWWLDRGQQGHEADVETLE
jgi:hypothetical protein